MVYTFYSFKGGVGRSMALANIAELMYRRGLKVLLVDFDLEAPGLERFFEVQNPNIQRDEILATRGVIDMVLSYKEMRTLTALNVPRPKGERTETGMSSASAISSNFPYPVEPLTKFIFPLYPESSNGGALYLIPAGKRPEAEFSLYAERVRAFDWDELYTSYDGQLFFDFFRLEAEKIADVVLVDSRTGIAEMTGVCTHHIADVVVMFAASNMQNLDGIKKIAKSLRRPELIQGTRGGRQVQLVMVPSRVEQGEGDKLEEFASLFERELSEFFPPELKFEKGYFLGLRIPYIPYYSYLEEVAVRDPSQKKAADLIDAYARLESALVELSPRDSRIYHTYFASRVSPVSPSMSEPTVERPRDFTGRRWVFESLDRWLGQTEPSTFLITGEPGSGKSTLARQLVVLSLEENSSNTYSGLGRDFLTYAHFCVAHDTRSLDPSRFIEALSLQLAARYSDFGTALVSSADQRAVKLEIRHSIGVTGRAAQVTGVRIERLEIGDLSPRVAFDQLLRRPLAQLCSAKFKQNIVILIDGIETALGYSGTENLITLLGYAYELPSQVRWIITGRSHPAVLSTIRGATVDLIRDAPQADDDVRNYALRRLSDQPKAKRDELATHVATVAQGNFLYARLTLDEVLARPDQAAQILSGELPQTLQQTFAQQMGQIVGVDQQLWQKRDRPLLGSLAVAFDGLSTGQLAGILGRSRSETSDALKRWAPFLHGELPDGPFRLFHSAFRNFLLSSSEYDIHAAEVHQAIANFFLKEHRGAWDTCEDLYALRYTPRHIQEALKSSTQRAGRVGLEGNLTALLTDVGFLRAKAERVGLKELAEDLRAAPKSSAILWTLGRTYFAMGEVELATRSYLEALAYVRESGDRRAEAMLLGDLGLAHNALGKVDDAIKYHSEHLTIAREMRDQRSEGAALRNLGNASLRLGDLQRAVTFHSQALSIGRELRDEQEVASELVNLGTAYARLGEATQARAAYEEALNIVEKTHRENPPALAIVQNNLGNVLWRLGDLAGARAAWEGALSIFRQINDERSEQIVLKNLSQLQPERSEETRSESFVGDEQIAIGDINGSVELDQGSSESGFMSGTGTRELDALFEPVTESTVFDTSRTQEFVKSIDISGSPRGILFQDLTTETGEVFDKAKSQAQVVGAGVFCFAHGVAPEIREAISDSALLAQLVANKKLSARDRPLDWFAAYTDVLQNIGWTLQQSGWYDYTAKGTAVEVREKILEIMTVSLGLSPAALAIISATINALNAMTSESPWITIFNRESKKGKMARFEIGLVEQEQSSNIFVSLLGCLIEAKTEITQVLAFKLKDAGAIFRANSGKVSINGAVLTELSPSIRSKIRAYQADYLSTVLDIPPTPTNHRAETLRQREEEAL